MRPLLFVVLVAIAVLLVWLIAEAAEESVVEHDSVQMVATWGRTAPPYVIADDMFTTTTQPRARTAPSKQRTTMRAASAAPAMPLGVLQDMIRTGFARFGPEVPEQAVHVGGCESTGDETGQNLNPAARNGDHWGLFQIAWRYHKDRAARLGITSPEQLLDPGTNITLAADIFAESRWGPWTCRWAA